MQQHERAVVILVEFRAREGARDAFLDIIREHARTSRREEPGCLQFDVVEDEADPNRVVLYEVWADEEAFRAHQALPRMETLRARTEGLLEERRLAKLARVAHPPAGGPVSRRILVSVPHLADRRPLLRPLEEAGYELVLNPHGRTMNEQQLLELLPGCVATLAGSEPYNDRVLGRAPELRVIARLGVGYDQIDLEAATRRGVAVAMAFGTNHDAVADHAFALMAACASRIPVYDARVRAGGWGSVFHGRLHGTTVGIVGFGRIGRALAKRCHGFGMEVVVADPFMDADTVGRLGCRLVSLDQLLRGSDFVSIHAPLNPDTRHLIDAGKLALMKPHAFLVNTARGGIVDEAALVKALEEGRIAGAGLDVFETEPLPADSRLRDLQNVVLSPHVAGVSDWAVDAMGRRCVESILEILQGVDPGDGLVLNPEALRAGVA
jgi:phosphoglycerate dehydrogenase-like enzyme/quinol monooxygenase YgiN